MSGVTTRYVGGIVLAALVSATGLAAAPLNVYDTAMERFLQSPFQFDYTTVTDAASLHNLVTALDHELAVISCRQVEEFLRAPGDSAVSRDFRQGLEDRYRTIMTDGFLFKKLADWRGTIADSTDGAFIDLVLQQYEERQVDPAVIRDAAELARSIADRLYGFVFSVDQKRFDARQAAGIIADSAGSDLARRLYRLQNDSARTLGGPAAQLYRMYNRMGQSHGFRTSLDFTLSRYALAPSTWLVVADSLTRLTEAEYGRCLESFRAHSGRSDPALFEIDRYLHEGAQLPDSFFTVAKVDTAVAAIFRRCGLDSLLGRLTLTVVDSASWEAVAVRVDPPYRTRLLEGAGGGFEFYRRLVTEAARALPCVFADSALPSLLRDYPLGTEEMLTATFEQIALDSAFLVDRLAVPSPLVSRCAVFERWQTIFRIRQVTLFYYLDYYLSKDDAARPDSLYWSLESRLLGTSDSTGQWIETLITGELQKYPKWLAHIFSRTKLSEMLRGRFGDRWMADSRAGKFIIDSFCRPGRSQTMKQFVERYSSAPWSVDDLRRQLQLK